MMEKEMDKGNRADEVAQKIMEAYGQCDQFSKELYCVIIDKAEGEADDEIRAINDGRIFSHIFQFKRNTDFVLPHRTTVIFKCVDNGIKSIFRCLTN